MFDNIPVSELWYPPVNVLYHGNKRLGDTITASLRKQINESMSVAIMLIGLNKQHGEDYRLQIVDQSEQTPDVRSMRIVPKDGINILEVHEIEVVTLEVHSDESADDFLKRTKLNSKKSYPSTTTILCHINKNLVGSKSWVEVHEALKDVDTQNDVYVLARIDPIEQRYQLVKVHPTLEIVEFDVQEELLGGPSRRVLKMRPGTNTEFSFSDEKHIPFE